MKKLRPKTYYNIGSLIGISIMSCISTVIVFTIFYFTTGANWKTAILTYCIYWLANFWYVFIYNGGNKDEDS